MSTEPSSSSLVTKVQDFVNDLPPYFLYGIYTGFIGIIFFFYLAKYVIVPFCTTKDFQDRISKLPKKDQNYFYVTVPSMIHSIVHSIFHPGWIFFGFSEPHNMGRTIYFDPGWPSFFQGIFVGYLLGDFFWVLGPRDLGLVYCIHHISASSQWIYSTSQDSMQYYGSFMQFCEFSTIFLNIRQWILTAGYSSSSKPGMICSGLFFLAFFLVRVVPLPMIIYNWTTKDYAELRDAKGTTIAVGNTVTIVINVLLQTSWFGMMVMKIVKMLGGGSKKKSGVKKEK